MSSSRSAESRRRRGAERAGAGRFRSAPDDFHPESRRPWAERARLFLRHMTEGRGGMRVTRPSYAPCPPGSPDPRPPGSPRSSRPGPFPPASSGFSGPADFRRSRRSRGSCRFCGFCPRRRSRRFFRTFRSSGSSGSSDSSGTFRSFRASCAARASRACRACCASRVCRASRAVRRAGPSRKCPGARGRRGLSSPVPTRSPELPGSAPADRLPRAARLPLKVSPHRRRSFLPDGHSYEGCYVPDRGFCCSTWHRIVVR